MSTLDTKQDNIIFVDGLAVRVETTYGSIYPS